MVSENKDEQPKITRRKPRKKGWFDLDEKPGKRRRKGIWPWDW
jgi:hypothetical protein